MVWEVGFAFCHSCRVKNMVSTGEGGGMAVPWHCVVTRSDEQIENQLQRLDVVAG